MDELTIQSGDQVTIGSGNVLSVEKLSAIGYVNGNGMIETNCDLLTGIDNIAMTISTSCRVGSDHFYIDGFRDMESIFNNDRSIGVPAAVALGITAILEEGEL